MSKKDIKGTEALLLALEEQGVETVFGYPGGTIMPLYDELYRFSDRIKHILVRHEQGAVHAAEGYARATGRVGVCLATAGPGATNLVTGIADAMMDSTPLVCITAQVTADMLGTNFFQEADTISITIPITKWSYQITKASEVHEIVAKAFFLAKSGRPGPVLISFTKNAQLELTDFKHTKYAFPCKQTSFIDESVIDKAAEMINESERPLILAGQGIIISNAEKELEEFMDKSNIPAAATLMGLSAISSSHKLFTGMVGMHGNIAPNLMTQQSDLIIAVGMRFSDRVTGDTSRYAPKAKIIHIDIDKAEFNKTIKADITIQADARLALDHLRKGVNFKNRKDWIEFAECKKELERKSIVDKLLRKKQGKISMAQVIDTIAKIGEGDAIIVTDVGQNQMFSARYSKFNRTRSLITSGGLGTMGYGLPAAIGAKLGLPERQVLAILGDGGFQMNLQELGTVMQSKIGVKIVVLNNSYLGMVRQWQELFFERRYSNTSMLNPDFLKIAESYKIPAKRVERFTDLNDAVEEMFSASGAYLLEVVVEKEENVFPMVPNGASLNDMIS